MFALVFAPVGFPECLLEWRMCQRAPASGLAPRVSRYSDGEISHAITNSKGKQRITFPIASASFSYGTATKVTQLGRRRRLAYARRLSLQPATAPTRRQPHEGDRLRRGGQPHECDSTSPGEGVPACGLCALGLVNQFRFLTSRLLGSSGPLAL